MWQRGPHYIGSTSGYKGVCFQRSHVQLNKPWRAYLRHHGEFRLIGYFKTKEQAARAYDKEALRLFGPKTYLNRNHGCRPRKKRRQQSRIVDVEIPTQDPKELLRQGLEILRQRRLA